MVLGPNCDEAERTLGAGNFRPAVARTDTDTSPTCGIGADIVQPIAMWANNEFGFEVLEQINTFTVIDKMLNRGKCRTRFPNNTGLCACACLIKFVTTMPTPYHPTPPECPMGNAINSAAND